MKSNLFIPSVVAAGVLAGAVLFTGAGQADTTKSYGPSVLVAAQNAGAAAAIKARKNHMKKINKPAIRQIMKAVKAGKAGPPEAAAAAKIRTNMPKFMKLFPKGSGPGKIKTRVKDTIWSDFSGFQGKNNQLTKTLIGFEAAAKSGNAGATDKAMRALVSSCNACHKAYGGWKRIKIKK